MTSSGDDTSGLDGGVKLARSTDRARSDAPSSSGHEAAAAANSADAAKSADAAGVRCLRLGLREGMELLPAGEGCFRLQSFFGSLILKNITPGIREALTALTDGGATVDSLSDTVLEADGGPALARLYYYLDQLGGFCALTHTAMDGETPIATIIATGRGYRFTPRPIEAARLYQLSRFALMRREQDKLLLESPLGHGQVVLHDGRASALMAMLIEPRKAADLAAILPQLEPEAVDGCIQLLLNAEALTGYASGTSMSDEDNDPALLTWATHDLLFHTRSRFGRHTGWFGASFRHAGRIPPAPAVKAKPEGETIVLYRPDMRAVTRTDPPLAAVMEARKSVYQYDLRPITAKQLGEFLYRVARVREQASTIVEGPDGHAVTMEVTGRPYPNGGRSYDLELYLVVDRCDGLDSGLYHYDPLGHRLTRLRQRDEYVEALLHYVTVAARGTQPQLLIVMASRFQRVSWKYDAIAYATTLKHVGVLFQSMYLVATAMGLAPCALGSGDAELFAAAAGTDYRTETSVGEFMLGSAPATLEGQEDDAAIAT